MATLGLTGDVMLGRGVDRVQREARPPTAVWGDVLPRMRGLDGLLVNLECCLSTRGTPWRLSSHPYHFRADPAWAVPALRAAGVDCCSLANNHVLDYGVDALADTFEALDGGGIPFVGAGRTEREAWRPVRFAVGTHRVAVVAFTDNTPEFAAGVDTPGTAHTDIAPADRAVRRRVRDALDAAREGDTDVLLASLHWGPNMRERPPEGFRQFARWLVDEGVDVVHGHSAHVFQGVEVYDGSLVLYDTGDFVDDYATDPDLRNDRGFLFEVELGREHVESVRLVPTEIRDYAVHRAKGATARWSRDRMERLSTVFGTRFERDDGTLVCHVTE